MGLPAPKPLGLIGNRKDVSRIHLHPAYWGAWGQRASEESPHMAEAPGASRVVLGYAEAVVSDWAPTRAVNPKYGDTCLRVGLRDVCRADRYGSIYFMKVGAFAAKLSALVSWSALVELMRVCPIQEFAASVVLALPPDVILDLASPAWRGEHEKALR